MAGLRPVEIWVPDTRLPGFAEECRRQSRTVASSSKTDEQVERLMDDAVAAVDAVPRHAQLLGINELDPVWFFETISNISLAQIK
ncbi:hypothetical protein A3839_00280 [Achromobacter insolitus]|nr:hypothetical protein A3839_00280 [Achromobacter insolitus]